MSRRRDGVERGRGRGWPNQIGGQFEAVLLAAGQGEGSGAERIWRSLAPAVAGYLRVQGAPEPDDLTSEVFLSVFRSLSSFSGNEEEFRSWVFTIAHRRLVDERRRAGRRPALSHHAPMPEDGPGGESVEGEALQRLSTARVRNLCEHLVADQRDVLLLRLVGGLTVEETAAALTKSAGAVKALQRRALIALRKILSQEGVPQ